jgi:hypothetical protein
MKDFIKIRLHEGLFDDIPDEMFERAYKGKINELYDNLLVKGERNSGYRFILGNKIVRMTYGYPNKCETNAFNFVKEKLSNGEDNFYPVSGYGFEGKNLFPVEHWWVYDKNNDTFLEVTPLIDGGFRCYAGIINGDIQSDIASARNFYDVDFFKGGNAHYNYFK